MATEKLDVVAAAAAGSDWNAGDSYGKLVLGVSVTRTDGSPVLGLRSSSFHAYVGGGLAYEPGPQIIQDVSPANVTATSETGQGFYTVRVGPGSGLRWSNPGSRVMGLLVRNALHGTALRGQTMTAFEMPPAAWAWGRCSSQPTGGQTRHQFRALLQ